MTDGGRWASGRGGFLRVSARGGAQWLPALGTYVFVSAGRDSLLRSASVCSAAQWTSPFGFTKAPHALLIKLLISPSPTQISDLPVFYRSMFPLMSPLSIHLPKWEIWASLNSPPSSWSVSTLLLSALTFSSQSVSLPSIPPSTLPLVLFCSPHVMMPHGSHIEIMPLRGDHHGTTPSHIPPPVPLNL